VGTVVPIPTLVLGGVVYKYDSEPEVTPFQDCAINMLNATIKASNTDIFIFEISYPPPNSTKCEAIIVFHNAMVLR
jgi:hypothetical protein